MTFPLSRVPAATVAFWVTTTIAVASVGTLVAITISLGIDSTHPSQTHGLLLAAAALDILCLIGAVVAASLFILRVSRRAQLLCDAGFVLLATAAALITIYSLASLWNVIRGQDTEYNEDIRASAAVVQAGFAVWAIATFSQILLYAIILWPYKRDDSGVPANELAARLQQVQTPKKSLSVRLASLSSPRTSPQDRSLEDPTASHFSSPSLSPRSSFRRSVSQAIRPMTSKTRLLLRSSNISRDSPSFYSRDTSMETPRAQNEFRDWDTSGAIGLEDQQHDPFKYSRSTRSRRLDPIPGSRPVSPAKPLDGPFPSDGPEDAPLPDSPMASPVLSQSDLGSFRGARPRAVSRPPSNQSQEAHIHPLFRSESPNPPPIASPGTIITASPYAHHVVSADHQVYFPPPPRMLRSAQSSRPASPSPLSPSRSRQGSFRSIGMPASSPVDVRSASALSWEASKEG